MDLRVLGPLEAVEDGQLLPLGGMKQRTVLALLIAHGGKPVSTDALIDGVYGEDAPSGARRSVQTYVSNLRSQLGDVIKPTGSGYVLGVPDEGVDAIRFEALIAEAATLEDPAEASARLQAALATWRGHPYDDVDGFGPIPSEISRLNELRMVAVERRVDADLDDGKHAEIVAELESLTAAYPFRERFHGQHMLALYRSGRQAESLRAFEKARAYLVDEMGLDPSPELRTLEHQILEHDPALGYEPRPAIRRVAVLVADVDDPSALAGTDAGNRMHIVDRHSELTIRAIDTHGGEVFAQRGTAIYSWFDSAAHAASAAEDAQWSLADVDDPGFRLRVAIDFGDIQQAGSAGIQGPPVARAAALLASARGGSVLLAAAAHTELTSQGGDWQIRGLGTPKIDGLEAGLAVHLLQGGWPSNGNEPLRQTAILPAPPERSQGFPGYEWRDRVGSGAFGVVHRAYQPAVGREVAIKRIRPELSDDPAFIRRFEIEAQMVARLEHPHIVPLYDFWRDPDGAFLVMRWMGGGSLADRLRSGPLGLGEVSALLSQVGPALGAAHRKRVVHRDIRPENILRDEDGNWYLSDFGVAFIDAPDRGAGADISDLSRLLDTCLHESDRDAGVASVIETGVSGGYADVSGLLEAWDGAAGGVEGALVAPLTEARNPYKGLAAFGELDADDFHGRDALTGQLVAAVAERNVVAVVGPSGIGKSSVVRAGLIPAVRNGALARSQEWLITDMVPTAYPFEQLASALERIATRAPADLEDRLRKDQRGLLRATQRYLAPDSTLLLVIDQFEELFTLVPDEETRSAFLDVLAETAADPHSPVRIVLTVRADFFDRPLRYAEFGQLLRSGTVPASAPTDEELQQIIANPAAGVGVGFEPGLVDRIIADVGDQPGTLPLLEFALTRLFDHRTSDAMSSGDYDRVGGVLAALGRRAEQSYVELDDPGRDAARQVFMRLVNVSESGRPTRRRTRMTELAHLGFSSSEIHEVVDPLVQARLLTLDRDPVTRGPTVEVAHEALLTEWPRMADWIENQQEDLLLHSRLASAVTDWESSERAENYLLRAGRLEQHEAWTADTELSLTTVENEFLELSRRAEDERRAQRRRVRRRVLVGFGAAAVVASVLAVAALVARSDATEQAAAAESKALAAAAVGVLEEDPELSLLLALEAAAHDDLDPEAIEAVRAAMAEHRTIASEIWDNPMLWTTWAWMSPIGDLIAIGGASEALEVWDVASLPPTRLWAIEDVPVGYSVEPHFTTDGRHLAVTFFWLASQDPRLAPVGPDPALETALHLYDARSGDRILQMSPTMGECEGSHPQQYSFVPSFYLDMSGYWFSEGECEDIGRSWWLVDPVTSAPIGEPRPIGQDVGDIVLTANGWLVQDARSGFMIEHIETGQRYDYPPGALSYPFVSPSGRYHLGRTAVIDPVTGAEWESIPAGPESPGFIPRCFRAFNQPETMLFSACDDAVVRVHDTRTGRLIHNLAGHDGWVNAASNAAGDLVATGSADGTFRVWDLAQGRGMAALNAGDGYYADASLDVANGTGAVIVYPDETTSPFDLAVSVMGRYSVGHLELFDVSTLTSLGRIEGVAGKVARLSPDGSKVAVQSATIEGLGPVEVFDVISGDRLATMSGTCSFVPSGGFFLGATDECPFDGLPFAADVTDLDWSPDGSMLAMTAGRSKRVMVWDVATGDILFLTDPAGTYPFSAVQFNPEGSLLAASSKTGMWVFDTADWSEIAMIATPGRPSWVMEFTPDGGAIVTAQAHVGHIRIYDTETWEERIILTGAGQSRDLALNRDGTIAALANNAGVVHLVDLESGVIVDSYPLPATDVTNVEFVYDDARLLVTDAFGPVELLTLDNEELISVARSRLNRALSVAECEEYLIDPCPTLEEIRTGL